MTSANQTYRCNHCKRAIPREKVGAIAVTNRMTRLWCFDCWDNPDEQAVEEYRKVNLTAAPGRHISPELRDAILSVDKRAKP